MAARVRGSTRAFIFDLDGTLVDTVYAHVFAWQQALSEALRLDTDIHVNLARLRFIDVPSAAAIAKAALTLPLDRRMIVTCRPPVTAVLSLVGADEAPQLKIRRAHDGA